MPTRGQCIGSAATDISAVLQPAYGTHSKIMTNNTACIVCLQFGS
jgi:hypothetical protein